jgi:hypothetical protein
MAQLRTVQHLMSLVTRQKNRIKTRITTRIRTMAVQQLQLMTTLIKPVSPLLRRRKSFPLCA